MITNKVIDKLEYLLKILNIENIDVIFKYLIVISMLPMSEDNENLKKFFDASDYQKKIFYLYKIINEIPSDLIYKIYNAPSVDRLPRIYDDKEKDVVLLCLNTQGGFGDYVSTFRYLLELAKNVKKVYYPIPKEVKSLYEYNLNKYNICNVELLTENLEDIIINNKYDYIRRIHHIYYEKEYSDINIYNTIFVNPEDVEVFKNRYVNEKTFNIGISWKSDKGDYPPGRNTSLENFLSLTKIKNAQVYSLQYGISDSELKNTNIINLGKYFNNIYETAVGVNSMDLIVSVDNLIMNLSNTSGVKTLFLIPYNYPWCSFEIPNYRGFRDLNIFQNDEENNYKKTISNVKTEIENIISSLRK